MLWSLKHIRSATLISHALLLRWHQHSRIYSKTLTSLHLRDKMVVLTLRLQRYPDCTWVLHMAVDLPEQKGLNPDPPPPALALSFSPTGGLWIRRPALSNSWSREADVGNGRKKWRRCGRRKGDEQNPLPGQNLLSRRQADVAPTGPVTESWGKKGAGRNSLYISHLPCNEHHCPSSPTGQDNVLQFFCFLVLSIFLPGSSCHRSHLWVQEEILARELTVTWDRSHSSSARTEGSPSASVVLEEPEEGDDLQRSWWEKGKGREKGGGSSWKLTLFEPVLAESQHACVSHFQKRETPGLASGLFPTFLLIPTKNSS